MVLSSKGGIYLSAVICIRLDSGIKNYNLITTLMKSMYRRTLIVMLWRLSLNLELLQQMSLTLTARFLLDMDSRWWQSWDVSHRKIFHRWYKKIFDISIGQVGLYNYLFWLQSLVTTHFFFLLDSWEEANPDILSAINCCQCK